MSTVLSPGRDKSDKAKTGYRIPYLGVYCYVKSSIRINFEIHIGDANRFASELGSDGKYFQLSALKKIPKVWADDLESIYHDKPVYIGTISYDTHKNSAKTRYYYPRDELTKYQASRMPYFIEAVVVNILKNMGYKTISTSDFPEQARIVQLTHVMLPLRREVPISQWLRGMGRGIRYKVTEKERALASFTQN